jgi:hypothetical protein
VVDCFGYIRGFHPLIKSKTQMPEIKPVEPDPDNAGVGNNKTNGFKPSLQNLCFEVYG